MERLKDKQITPSTCTWESCPSRLLQVSWGGQGAPICAYCHFEKSYKVPVSKKEINNSNKSPFGYLSCLSRGCWSYLYTVDIGWALCRNKHVECCLLPWNCPLHSHTGVSHELKSLPNCVWVCLFSLQSCLVHSASSFRYPLFQLMDVFSSVFCLPHSHL